MRCQQCQRTMAGGAGHRVSDESGSLTITAWWCEPCDEVIEEIRTVPSLGKASPRRVRYAVRPSEGRLHQKIVHRTHQNRNATYAVGV
jgi:hypothetical protein